MPPATTLTSMIRAIESMLNRLLKYSFSDGFCFEAYSVSQQRFAFNYQSSYVITQLLCL